MTVPPVHLFAWLGQADQNAVAPDEHKKGPIHAALKTGRFERLCLLSNYEEHRGETYMAWISGQFPEVDVSCEHVAMKSPMDFTEIHRAAVHQVDAHRERFPEAKLCFHSSPGTPAMAVVWIILGYTRYDAELIRSHYDGELGRSVVKTLDFPFNLSAEFIGRLVRQQDERISGLENISHTQPGFEHIIHQSEVMRRVIVRASRIAMRDVPALILGESGTGKELLARAIHNTSGRGDKPFVAINCGAIPEELFESELFGHAKGAYTGAVAERKGAFLQAQGGTLFLDELGDLPLLQQVKLLRALQEKEIKPVGSDERIAVDVRLICATHRDLYGCVHEGSFREDLFHRIAVGVLTLPALRDRAGDRDLLVEHVMSQIHEHNGISPSRRLSEEARQRLAEHTWPGNIRELYNTLLRAVLWTGTAQIIERADIEESILKPPTRHKSIMDHELDTSFNINARIDEIKKHYIFKALAQSKTKTEAAKLLGLKSHQVLTGWMKALDIA